MSAPFWVVAILLKGTLLLVAAVAVTAVLRRASAAVRHLIWGLGILTILALPLVSIGLPWRLAVIPLERVPAIENGPTTPTLSSVPQVRQDTPGNVARPDTTLADVAAMQPAQANTGRAFLSALNVSAILLTMWGLVVIFLLARLAFGALVLRRVVRRATPLSTPDWRHPLLEAADRLSLPELPRLVMSDRFPMPFACGILQPAIVLPSGAADWDDRRRRTVLVHELAHLARRDLLVNALGQAACALYWFHPLVWMAARKLRIESERACDDLVLGVGTRPSEYADYLLQIVCRASRSRTPAVALPMAQRHEFEGRMLAILERVARREPASGRHAMVLGALALSFVILLAALSPVRSEIRQATTTSLSPPATPTVSLKTTVRSTSPSRSPPATPPPSASSTAPSPRVDTTAVVSALVRALGDSVASVREDAAYALGQLHAASAVEPLTTRLGRDPSPKVREMIAWALGQIENRSATAALGAAAQRDSSGDVRAMAVWALAQIADPAAVPMLTALLADRSVEVRGRAAWAIGTIEPSSAPTALVNALRDPSEEVRLRAAWALGQ